MAVEPQVKEYVWFVGGLNSLQMVVYSRLRLVKTRNISARTGCNDSVVNTTFVKTLFNARWRGSFWNTNSRLQKPRWHNECPPGAMPLLHGTTVFVCVTGDLTCLIVEQKPGHRGSTTVFQSDDIYKTVQTRAFPKNIRMCRFWGSELMFSGQYLYRTTRLDKAITSVQFRNVQLLTVLSANCERLYSSHLLPWIRFHESS